MLRPRTIIAVASSVIYAGLIIVLLVFVHRDGIDEGFPIPLASFATPVILLLGGSFFLLRGSRIARAFARCALCYEHSLICRNYCIPCSGDRRALGRPANPDALVLLPAVPGWLLLFSRVSGGNWLRSGREGVLGNRPHWRTCLRRCERGEGRSKAFSYRAVSQCRHSRISGQADQAIASECREVRLQAG